MEAVRVMDPAMHRHEAAEISAPVLHLDHRVKPGDLRGGGDKEADRGGEAEVDGAADGQVRAEAVEVEAGDVEHRSWRLELKVLWLCSVDKEWGRLCLSFSLTLGPGSLLVQTVALLPFLAWSFNLAFPLMVIQGKDIQAEEPRNAEANWLSEGSLR